MASATQLVVHLLDASLMLLVARLAGASLKLLVARLAGASLMDGFAGASLMLQLVARVRMGAAAVGRKQRAVAWPIHHQLPAFCHNIDMALCHTLSLREQLGRKMKLVGVH